jgi:DNA-binding NtrC family response regulator
MKMPEKNKMKRWILPPSLKWTFQEFIDLYDSLQGDSTPILIIGPRGVGKTLFANAFAKLHERDHRGSKTTRINIAAIPENLLESQLFGHVKGAFTGATSNYKGLIGEAAGGVLILEEIGELKPEVQAKLLTFIEDGFYYQVGSTTAQRIRDVQIVATTNRTKDDNIFRDDFIDRFFPFYIPPLYKRREDILYYLAYKFPDVIRELRPWEILTLLAYNWPGNVREIETVGRVIRWKKSEKVSRKLRKTKYDSSLRRVPDGYSGLTGGLLNIEKYNMNLGYLKHAGINDVELLEALLNKRNLGLDTNNTSTPFEKYKYVHTLEYEGDAEVEELFDVEICTPVHKFDSAITGIVILYGSLFSQSYFSERDMLDIQGRYSPISENADSDLIEHAIRLLGGKFSEKRIAALINSTRAYIKSMAEDETKELDVFSMTYKEILTYYFNGLLERTNGNKARAAKLADLPESTFKHKLRSNS